MINRIEKIIIFQEKDNEYTPSVSKWVSF